MTFFVIFYRSNILFWYAVISHPFLIWKKINSCIGTQCPLSFLLLKEVPNDGLQTAEYFIVAMLGYDRKLDRTLPKVLQYQMKTHLIHNNYLVFHLLTIQEIRDMWCKLQQFLESVTKWHEETKFVISSFIFIFVILGLIICTVKDGDEYKRQALKNGIRVYRLKANPKMTNRWWLRFLWQWDTIRGRNTWISWSHFLLLWKWH